jgi:hypothetical protein
MALDNELLSSAVATPVNWKQGEDVVIAGSVSNDEAKEIYGTWKELVSLRGVGVTGTRSNVTMTGCPCSGALPK